MTVEVDPKTTYDLPRTAGQPPWSTVVHRIPDFGDFLLPNRPPWGSRFLIWRRRHLRDMPQSSFADLLLSSTAWAGMTAGTAQICVGTDLASTNLEGATPDWMVSVRSDPESPEKRWFSKMKPNLLSEYKDRYVAVHDSKVVDSDTRLSALLTRFFRRYGDADVYIGFVGEQPAAPPPSPVSE